MYKNFHEISRDASIKIRSDFPELGPKQLVIDGMNAEGTVIRSLKMFRLTSIWSKN